MTIAVPGRLIDREAEQQLFEGLVRLEGTARLLTVRDRGGQGKSSLLRVLRHSCMQRPVPVSLVSFADLEEHTELELVKRIRDDLRRERLVFPRFDEIDAERRRRLPPKALGEAVGAALESAPTRFQAGVEASEAQFHNSKLVGQEVHLNLAPGDTAQWLSREEENELIERSIEAFFEELAVYCAERLVVLMFDTFEKCDPSLGAWLLEDFLRWQCFELEHRPARLVVVIAGRKVPPCEAVLGPERYERLVVPVPALSPLEDHHVRELFREKQFEPTDEEVRVLRDAIRNGTPIKAALQIIDLLKGGENDA